MGVASVLAGVGLAPVRKGCPLPLHPAGSVAVGPGVDLVENEAGGVVSLWGMAAWCWEPADVAGRRLAAVGLVATGAATQVEVAAGFGVDDATLRRWSRSWEAGGAQALAPEARGPKGPSKLDEDKLEEIRSARARGLSMEAVAAATGVSLNSVSRALRGNDPARPSPPPPPPATSPGPGADLVPLAAPEPRTAERQAARAGLLAGAPPVICEGASLPMAGALLVLPALLERRVGDEHVVDRHVQCCCEGVQISVHAVPPGSGCSVPLILDVLARRVVDPRALSELPPFLRSTLGANHLGVLYHLPDPLLALERVASVARRQLIMETHVDLLGIRRPAAAFYPDNELQGDSSNWWGPNLAAAKGMLQTVGFSRVEVVFVSPWTTRLARAVKHRSHGRSAFTALRQAQGRAVFHAFKDEDLTRDKISWVVFSRSDVNMERWASSARRSSMSSRR